MKKLIQILPAFALLAFSSVSYAGFYSCTTGSNGLIFSGVNGDSYYAQQSAINACESDYRTSNGECINNVSCDYRYEPAPIPVPPPYYYPPRPPVVVVPPYYPPRPPVVIVPPRPFPGGHGGWNHGPRGGWDHGGRGGDRGGNRGGYHGGHR